MRQRYYNPETKRFLNQDILTGSIGNSQSLNRYSYVQGNPVSSTDPFGLSPLNMTEGTGLIHGILGLLGCVPGPIGIAANTADAAIYLFVDHDYGMATLSLISAATMGAGSIAKGAKAAGGAAKTAAGAAKAAKIARTAEYVRTAGSLISNAATFTKSGINLWQDGNKLYQKYKAGEKISTAEAITVGLEAVACAVSGVGMVGEAKTLGRMMKEDNVVGRLKESVGRFGNYRTLVTGRGSDTATNKISNLYRRTSNVGDFKDLDELMQLKRVKNLAKDAGIGLDGVKIKIDRNKEMIGRGLYGFTDGKTITLYPDAFTDTETLVKTLGHERMHIYQVSVFGKPTSTDMLKEFEKAAYESEKSWWAYYKLMKGIK